LAKFLNGDNSSTAVQIDPTKMHVTCAKRTRNEYNKAVFDGRKIEKSKILLVIVPSPTPAKNKGLFRRPIKKIFITYFRFYVNSERTKGKVMVKTFFNKLRF
jgi:hypothetical protein